MPFFKGSNHKEKLLVETNYIYLKKMQVETNYLYLEIYFYV